MIVLDDKKQKDDPLVAAVVNLASNCREFRCLPGPGSLMEQDCLLVYMCNIVQSSWREREELDTKRREAEARQREAEAKSRR